MNPMTTKAEAVSAVDDLTALFEDLSSLLQRETVLVHAGQVRKAGEFEPQKRDLAAKLYAAGERLKANAKFILQSVPERCATLKTTQESLRAVVQRNMIVLATAHAVSEGIVHRLSGELARKAAPQVYGASGRTVAPNPRHGRPLAISRTL
jgi:flagellar biosynthesis/type III secretory pathway chaperone